MKNSFFKLVFLILLTNACSGGGSGQLPQGDGGAVNFLGAENIKANADGTWTLNWSSIVNVSNLKYRVYKKSSQYDFTNPVFTTETNYYVTEDLRLVGNTCYIVRVLFPDGFEDKNELEKCTGHEVFSFEGLSELVSLKDSTYSLKWSVPNFEGARFQVYEREFDKLDWRELAVTSKGNYVTRKISLDKVYCYRVRYKIQSFPEDQNEASLCTASSNKELFMGVENLSSPTKGELKVTWKKAEGENVSGYRIYFGQEFKELVTEIKGKDIAEYTIPDLLHAVIYKVGVRAFDKFGREDSNAKVLSFELKNHVPVIKSIALVPKNLNQYGRPGKISCVIDYSDEDEWQTLKPTFYIKNNKRENLGLVERAIYEENANTKTITYTVLEDDNRADSIICSATINDGFDNSIVYFSEPFVIPDTPVVGTGLSLTTLENKELEIIIGRGSNQGYVDDDYDEAVEITYATTKGTMSTTPGFSCTEGTCTGKFKPNKDFYTNFDLASPNYATITYQVRAGDSISEPKVINILVRPIPRALGYEMLAQQDKEQLGYISFTNDMNNDGTPDVDADDRPLAFNAYLHNLNHPATKLYVRHPLSQNYYNGKIQLPPGAPAGDNCDNTIETNWIERNSSGAPILDGSGNTIPVMGFECTISCDSNGHCPFVFLGNPSFFGASKFEYAVLVDDIQSNYATASLEVLPNLRALPFTGLTVEGQPYEIVFKERQGYLGTNEKVVITSVVVDAGNVFGTGTNLNFTAATCKDINNNDIPCWKSVFAPSAGVKGADVAKFRFSLTANSFDDAGQLIEVLTSNWAWATIHYYPLPVATGLDTQALQDNDRVFPTGVNDPFKLSTDPSGKLGYYHLYLSQSISKVLIADINLPYGYITQIGSGATTGEVPCAGGVCSFTFKPEPGVYDPQDNSEQIKFTYRVQLPVDQGLLDNPDNIKDGFLSDSANIMMTSNQANAIIKIRPIPVAQNYTLYVKENTAEIPSAKTIYIDPIFLAASPLDGATDYSHPYDFKAKFTQVAVPPIKGVLASFGCDIFGTCSAQYTPEVGFIGSLTPNLDYTVTVEDLDYTLRADHLISSLPKDIDIDVRPVPKGSGLTYVVRENTDFAPSSINLIIADTGTKIGYTHAYGDKAHTVNLVKTDANIDPGGVGVLGDLTCTNGSCQTSYASTAGNAANYGYYGTLNFTYTVTTNDAFLGDITSYPKTLALKVKPLPRTVDLGNSTAGGRLRVNEDTPRTFNLGLQGSGQPFSYTHQGGLKAKSIILQAYDPGQNGAIAEVSSTAPTGSCNATTGICQITFSPKIAYEGNAYVDYQVVVFDPDLGQDVVSNISRIWIDVYPRPRGTERHAYVLANGVQPIQLKLRTGLLLDESAYVIKDRLGYTHRRDDPAENVLAFTSPPANRGSVGLFACTVDSNHADYTICKADYTAKDFDAGITEDIFKYTVQVGGLVSSPADFHIEVRPTIVPTDFNLVIVENTPITIDFDLNGRYTHPLSAEGIVAKRIEIVNTPNKGTPVVLDIGTGAENPCDVSGLCQITFTPDTDYYTPDSDLTEAHFEYRMINYDPELNAEVASKTARVNINVRPRPKIWDKEMAQVQGVDATYDFSPAGVGYLYPVNNQNGKKYVEKIHVITGTIEHGAIFAPSAAIEPGGANCNGATGICSVTFRAAVAGEPYFHQTDKARYNYKVSVYDDYLKDFLYSDIKTLTIDFRPRPRGTGKTVAMWQRSTIPIEISKPNGSFDHPYYDGNPDQYKPISMQVLEAPVEGNIVAGAGAFNCILAQKKCVANFTPNDNYYYPGTGPLLKLKYRVGVTDAVIPTPAITSLNEYGWEQDINIEVKPIVINLGKSTRGVQTANHNIVIAKGDAYSYPATLTPPPLTVTIISETQVGGSVVNGTIICDNGTGTCTGTWQPDSNNTFGVTSFQYKITTNDPTLGAKDSEIKTYTVDLFPIPYGRDRLSTPKPTGKGYTGNHFVGQQDNDYVVNLLPGQYPADGLLCPDLEAGWSGSTPSYNNRYCAYAVEVLPVSGSYQNASFINAFPCDALGRCYSTFRPNAIGGSWPGFGISSFQYKVRIAPSVLNGIPLNASEQAALISSVKTIEVEYYPNAYTTSVSLEDSFPGTDYLYLIQAMPNQSFPVTRCNTPTVQADCHKGYVHGYDENATNIIPNNMSLISLNNGSCESITGNCQLTVSPNSLAFYTTGTNYATIDFQVTVAGKTSPNTSTVKLNIYPIPVANDVVGYGLEGDDIVIDLKPSPNAGFAYQHPFGNNAVKVFLTSQIDESKMHIVNMDTNAIVSRNDVTQLELESLIKCGVDGIPAGTCRIKLRPTVGTVGKQNFFYKVLVAGPTNMPTLQKEQLLSEQQMITASFYPKPRASGLELVMIEGDPLVPFDLKLNQGYTHQANQPATLLKYGAGGSFPGTSFVPGKIVVNDVQNLGVLGGTFVCDGSSTNCVVTCNGGTCASQFQGNTSTYSNTKSITNGCADVGANCPIIDYKIAIVAPAPANLTAWADDLGQLKFNVRPVPKISNIPVGTYIQAEGEAINIALKNGANLGYTYPFTGYGPDNLPYQIRATVTASSHFNGTPVFDDCPEVSTVRGVCGMNFTPDPSYSPISTDKYGTIEYTVKVYDPTIKVLPSTEVGDLVTKTSGLLKIEYRPKPRATGKTVFAVQDQSQVVNLSLGDGYTYTYNTERKASKITIVGGSATNIQSINTCTDLANDCEIGCDGSGVCPVTATPANGYFGNQAKFSYFVHVNDTAFSPIRILKSPSSALVTFDVRPLPLAQDITFVGIEGSATSFSLDHGAAKGYTHPYDATGTYLATGVSPSAIPSGHLSVPFGCTLGKCDAEYTTTSPGFYGHDSYTYTITVFDPVMGQDITSTPKTITMDIRPKPDATGLAPASYWTTLENSNGTIPIMWGTLAQYKGYYYPNDASPNWGYDVHPNAIDIVTPPNAGNASLSAFSCSTGAQTKGCSATVTVVNNVFGYANFSYRVSVIDSVLNQSIWSLPATYNMDVRPRIYASEINTLLTESEVGANANTVGVNPSFKAIEGTPLSFQIANGSNLGFSYPVSDPTRGAEYTALLNTNLVLKIINPDKGAVTPGYSCTNGICTGTFTPSANQTNRGSFDFYLELTDAKLPSGQQVITSATKKAYIDIYPKPTTNNLLYYTVEGEPRTIKIDRGASLGYEHARNHDIKTLDITYQTPGVVTTSAPSCAGSFCTTIFDPKTFKTANEGNLSEGNFTFGVEVEEPGVSRGPAYSKNISTVSVAVYPKPLVSAGASFTNIPVWENEPYVLQIKAGTGLGYTHLWSHQAKYVRVNSLSAGSSFAGSCTSGDTCFVCVTGTCTGTFTPVSSGGGYGNNKANFNYDVGNTYAPLAPARSTTVWSTNPTDVSFNVRAVPSMPTSISYNSNIESTAYEALDITGKTLTRGQDYFYADNTGQVGAIKFELASPSHLSCAGGCVVSTNCSSGTCTLPTLIPDLDWNRVDGLASVNYRVLIKDTAFTGAAQERWSDWSRLDFSILPRGRGTATTEIGTGIAGEAKNVVIGLGSGYTHDENAKASKIKIITSPAGSTSNVTITNAVSDEVSCDANGDCSLTVLPNATAFSAVAGKTDPASGVGYGWAKITYQVTTPVTPVGGGAAVQVLSTPGVAYVYFRPRPTPDNISITTAAVPSAIEATNYSLTIRLKGTGGCVSGCGYIHPLSWKADSIDISNLSSANAEIVNSPAPSCVVATGVCTVIFKGNVPDRFTFDYLVTVKDTFNNTLLAQSTPGTATIDVVPRPQAMTVAAQTVYEGRAVDIMMTQNSVGYKHIPVNAPSNGAVVLGGHNAKGLEIISAPAKGTYKGVLAGAPQNCSTLYSASPFCNCNTHPCALRFSPNASLWTNAQGDISDTLTYRVRDESYLETNGTTPLLQKGADGTISLTIRPRVLTNSRDYPSGASMGVEGANKTVSIVSGSGGTNAGGYIHTMNPAVSTSYTAKSISIESITGATVSCGTPPCSITCTTGTCTVPLTPLSGGSFVTSASFDYNITDNSSAVDGGPDYTSHKKGTSSVYFYPLPKATTKSIVIAKNSPAAILQITQGSGYTHLTTGASSWINETNPLQGATPNGTLGSFSCTSGNCTATYTPGANTFSTSSSDIITFQYSVTNNVVAAPDGGPVSSVKSPSNGTYSIEIFPKPVASAKTVTWVEGEGDLSKAVADRMKITIKKGVDYTHDRDSNPDKIIVSGVTGGDFSGGANPFSCGGDTCTATFIPSATSVDASTPAAHFDYKVEISGYSSFPSDAASYDIIIMPKPIGYNFTFDTLQHSPSTPTSTFKFATAENLISNPKTVKAYTHGWGLSIAQFELVSSPVKNGVGAGTLTMGAPSGTTVQAEYTPTPMNITGDVTFTYRIKVSNGPNVWAWTDIKTGTLAIESLLSVLGAYKEAEWQYDPLVGNTTITINDINIARNASVGYDHKQGLNADKIIFHQITPSGKGMLNGVTLGQYSDLTSGVWTGSFTTEPWMFGHYYIEYSVCAGAVCTSDTAAVSPRTNDQAKWLHIYVKPSDAPPKTCTKNITAFKNIVRKISIKQGSDPCQDGEYYSDTNTNKSDPNPANHKIDHIVQMNFMGATANLIASDSTDVTCSGTNPKRCYCNKYLNFYNIDGTVQSPNTMPITTTQGLLSSTGNARGWFESDCNFKVKYTTPNATGTNVLTYDVITHARTLQNGATYAPKSETTGTLNFIVINPLTPVAQNITRTAVEDEPTGFALTTYDVSEGTDGWLKASDIDPTNCPASFPIDRCPMAVDSIIISSYDNAKFSSALFDGPCTDGVCSIAINLQNDVTGTGVIYYQVVANGVQSAQKTLTVTITGKPDAPSSFGDKQYFSGNGLYRYQFYRNNYDYTEEGSFYTTLYGQGSPTGQWIPVVLSHYGAKPGNSDSVWNKGYFDVDGDKMAAVVWTNSSGTPQAATSSGAHNNYGTLTEWTCYPNTDNNIPGGVVAAALADGQCRAWFRPSAGGVGSDRWFYYRTQDTTGLWQGVDPDTGGQAFANWGRSSLRIDVRGDDSTILVTAKDAPDKTAYPAVSAGNWPASYTLVRGGENRLTFSRGVQYLKDQWQWYPGTEYASSIEIAAGGEAAGVTAPTGFADVDGVKGYDNDPGDSLAAGHFSCDATGNCMIDVKAKDTYPSFPAEASFWYRIHVNEDYTSAGHDFYGRLHKASEWKQVRIKIELGGCDFTPALASGANQLSSSGKILINEGITFDVGNNLTTNGNTYEHPGTGIQWRPLSRLEFKNLAYGTVTNATWNATDSIWQLPCVSGKCTETWNTQNNYMGAGSGFDVRVVDDYNCKSNWVNWKRQMRPQVATRQVCNYDSSAKPDCVRDDYAAQDQGITGGSTLLKIRKRKSAAQNAYGDFEYETRTSEGGTDTISASKVVLKNFTVSSGTLAQVLDGTTPFTLDSGVSCVGTVAAGNLVCTLTGAACDANGDCSATINFASGVQSLVTLSFKYDVYTQGNTIVSRGFWTRNLNYDTAQSGSYPSRFGFTTVADPSDLVGSTGTKYEMIVKPKPDIASISPALNDPANVPVTTFINEPVTIKLSHTANAGQGVIKAYNYPDLTIFNNRYSNISFGNPNHLQIVSNSYDPSTQIATVVVQPTDNFVGKGANSASFDYTVNVWGAEQTGTIRVNVDSYLTAGNITKSMTHDQSPLVIDVALGAEYTQNTPYTYKAATISAFDLIAGEGVSAVPGTCDGAGKCTISFTPATGPDFIGQTTIKYKLQAGPGGSEKWSNWATITIDVTASDSAPIVFDMDLNGKDTEPKLLVFSLSPSSNSTIGKDYGYFDTNSDKATLLEIVGASNQNGSVSPGTPITCTNGICLASFTPTPGYFTPSSPLPAEIAQFDFKVSTYNAVTTNTTQSAAAATVTVNFVPQIVATSYQTNGVKDVAVNLSIAKGSGYTYQPTDSSVTHLVITNPVHGSVVSSLVSCSAGSCPVTFNPTGGYAGDPGNINDFASFDYKVQIRDVDNTTVLKESNVVTAKIYIAAADGAPVAKVVTYTFADHDAYVQNIRMPNEYTDRENDLATALTVYFNGAAIVADGTPKTISGAQVTIAAAPCTAGTCTFTVDPDNTFEGPIKLTYKVTANSKASNTATIDYTVPAPGAAGFSLAWGAAPTLNAQCLMTVPGTVTPGNCGGASCDVFSATVPSTISNLANTGTINGFSVTVNKFATMGSFYSTWTVGEGANTITKARYLSLGETTPSAIKSYSFAPSDTPTTSQSQEGYQRLSDGCTGTSCNTSQRIGSISSGNGFACSLSSDSRVLCWGSNNRGKLGIYDNSDATFSLAETAISDPFDPNYELFGAVAVSAGSEHACALLSNSRVICWGDDTYGQIGNHTADDAQCSASRCDYPRFVLKDDFGTPLTGVVAISAGTSHTCAVTSAKKVYCWGRNDQGQLGDGTTADRSYASTVKWVDDKDGSDLVVSSIDITDAFSVSTGLNHSCMVNTNGNVLCWGNNSQYQLGDNNYYSAVETDRSKIANTTGATDLREFPVFVRDVSNNILDNVVMVSVGEQYSCALKNDGAVYCWGENDEGQINQNTATTSVANPYQIKGVGGTGLLGNIAQISAGKNHVCALEKDMGAVCWGSANISNSLLGNGVSIGSLDPVNVTNESGAADISDLRAISVGDFHTCALSKDGYVKCWGSNLSGAYGVGDTISQDYPTAGVLVNISGTKLQSAYRTCSKLYQISVP